MFSQARARVQVPSPGSLLNGPLRKLQPRSASRLPSARRISLHSLSDGITISTSSKVCTPT